MSPQASPKAVGPWTLFDRVGRGGMGEVWRAHSSDGRWVAVKILHVSGEANLPRRFVREARTILNLDHPNVVRAIDFGAGPPVPYLAMELLEGESLAQRLRGRRSLPVAQCVDIARQAAAGLVAAHAVGIVHRDVKPGNLFLCAGSPLTVKLLDFGLALQLESDDALDGTTRLTETGLVGTPSYMAPEQASGERGEDERTDVWGLGAVLYRSLSGRAPFGAGPYVLGEVFRILDDPPDPLPDHVPDAVRAVVLRSLEKDPSQRYASMLEMERALAAVEAVAAAAGDAIVQPDADGAPLSGSAPVAGAAGVAPVAGAPGGAGERPRTATRGSRAPIALHEEARLVAAVLAAGVRDAPSLERFIALAREHGATATPLQGRRALAVFGGAIWTGTEPLTAVRLALAARPLFARLGVGTGKAVLAPAGGGTVVGAALAAAAEAMQTAAGSSDDTDSEGTLPDAGAPDRTLLGGPGRVPPPPGPARPAPLATVGACPATLHRIAGGFVVQGARVLHAREGFRAPGVREVAGVEIPLTGRAAEVTRLTEAIVRAAAQSRAQAILVVGPPGIGKSRLRHEVHRWAIERSDGD